MNPPADIGTESLQRRAIELGLAALGVCRAEPYTGTEAAIAQRREDGLFADLKFTMARPESSCHPETLIPDARSVISAALCYWRPDAEASATDSRGRIARYTRWDGYAALHERLEVIAGVLRDAGHDARVLVDANDHVDREAAARSGVGFYGKHTNLITRTHGSWVVLGTIVTSAALESTEPLRPGCGSCTRCIDACPTDAIVDEGVLDVRSCITYWTQSRHAVPQHVRHAMGDMVYGCDICQDVCPWNRGVEKRSATESPLDGTVSLVEWLETPAEELNREYDRFFIPRRDVRYLRRNALIAMGNARRSEDAPIVGAWLESEDPMLREHAEWALAQIAALG
jgi:epoxyqueuosine reductase